MPMKTMESNERLFEITFAMMKDQKHKLMLDDFLYLNDNLSEERSFAEDEELKTARQLMPMKFMFTMTIVCLQGGICLNVNLMDMEMHENDALLLTPGSILEKMEPMPGSKLLIMAFANDTDNHALNFAAASVRKYFLRPAIFHGDKEDMEELLGLYKQMRLVLTHRRIDNTREKIENLLQGLVLLFMGQKSRFEKEQNYQRPTRQEEILLDFIQEVHDGCQEHRDLKYYADRLCLSASYLAHVVSETSGRHASEWIKDAVILEAKAMLRKGSYTVQQVSLALNFPNQSFFGKYFKSAVGMSPRQYQQEG